MMEVMDIRMITIRLFLLQVLLPVIGFFKACQAWPEGTYGIPMAKSGCPHSKDFQWLTGSRMHQTEPGSHASDPIHLAGMKVEKTSKVVQTFCVKTSFPGDGNHEWEPGKYCIMKKDDCPARFTPGFIYWDDAAPWFFKSFQNISGTVPDGEYGRNTRIEYCCRKDGRPGHPIRLPKDAPFFLLKWGDQCQMVFGMEVSDEWVYWADEDSVNFNGQGGLYPKVMRSKFPYKFTRLYYCYYQPKGPNQTLATVLTVVFVVTGLVGLLLISFIVACVIRRCCTRKQPPAFIISSSENTTQEYQMVRQHEPEPATAEPSPIYRPATAARMEGRPGEDGVVKGPPPKYTSRFLDGQAGVPPLDASCPVAVEPPIDNRPMSKPPTYDEVVMQKQNEVNANR